MNPDQYFREIRWAEIRRMQLLPDLNETIADMRAKGETKREVAPGVIVLLELENEPVYDSEGLRVVTLHS